MNLFSVMEQFSTPESCIEHLQEIRWGDTPKCPHCDSDNVAPKREGDKIGRWNCHLCKSSFNVLSGTMFQGTKIPLPKWFAGIALMVNAKKSLSSCQLARHLGMNQMSAWSMMQKIRAEMERKGETLLKGIIKADECYLGGKPRRRKNESGELPPAP